MSLFSEVFSFVWLLRTSGDTILAHVWKAAATWVEAYANDPEISYQRDVSMDHQRLLFSLILGEYQGQKQTSAVKTFDRIVVAALITLLMKRRVALTIESGAAFVFAFASFVRSKSRLFELRIVSRKPAHSQADPENPIGKVVTAIISGLAGILSRRVGTVEQRKVESEKPFIDYTLLKPQKRNQEVEEKTRKALDRVLGDRIKDMLTVMILATEPSSRKRGYGGALLDAVTSLVGV